MATKGKSGMDFNDILEMMVQKKASDLFITADIPPSIKVHGRITPVSKTRLSDQQSRELTHSLMSPEQREELVNLIANRSSSR